MEDTYVRQANHVNGGEDEFLEGVIVVYFLRDSETECCFDHLEAREHTAIESTKLDVLLEGWPFAACTETSLPCSSVDVVDTVLRKSGNKFL